MLSGRYISDFRTRHFNNSNPTGACRLCLSSSGSPAPPGTLEHLLLLCPSLQPAYQRAALHWTDHLASRPQLYQVVTQYCLGTVQSSVQFMLNPSCCPAVISAAQQLGETVFTDCHLLSRVWCYGAHTLRMKLLKLLGHI